MIKKTFEQAVKTQDYLADFPALSDGEAMFAAWRSPGYPKRVTLVCWHGRLPASTKCSR